MHVSHGVILKVGSSASRYNTHLHGIETLQLPNNLVDTVRRKSLTQKMVVLGFQLLLQLIGTISRIDRPKIRDESDPTWWSAILHMQLIGLWTHMASIKGVFDDDLKL